MRSAVKGHMGQGVLLTALFQVGTVFAAFTHDDSTHTETFKVNKCSAGFTCKWFTFIHPTHVTCEEAYA